MNFTRGCQLSVDDVKKISFSRLNCTSCRNFPNDSTCPLIVNMLCILVNKIPTGLQFTLHAWHGPGDACPMSLLGAIPCDLLGLTGLGSDALGCLWTHKPPRLTKRRHESCLGPVLSLSLLPQFLALLCLPWGCDYISSCVLEERLHWLKDMSDFRAQLVFFCHVETRQLKIFLLDFAHDSSCFSILHSLLVAPGT